MREVQNISTKHTQLTCKEEPQLRHRWRTSEATWETQLTVVSKNSSQNKRSKANTDENSSNASVWYLFNGQPENSAIFFKNGREVLLTFLFLIDQAVTHRTREGIRLKSSRNRLPRSGMCPPPYSMAILLWPSSSAVRSASVAALFLSPIMTDSSSTSAVTCVKLHKS